MKYNHILLITIVISSMISGMEIERSIKQKALNKWVYRETMTITFTNPTHNNHATYITLTDNQTDQANNNDDNDKSIKLTRSDSWSFQKRKGFDLVH